MPSGWGYPSKSSSSKPRSSRHSSSDPTSSDPISSEPTNPASYNQSTLTPSSARQSYSVPESSTPSGSQSVVHRPSSSRQISSVPESSTPSGSQSVVHPASASRQISSVPESSTPSGSQSVVHPASSSRQVSSVPVSSTPRGSSKPSVTKPSHSESGGKRQSSPKESSADKPDQSTSDESKKHPQKSSKGKAPGLGQREESTIVPSFIIRIKEFTPNYSNDRPPGVVETSQWQPPKGKGDFIFKRNQFFRWSSGRVQVINSPDEFGGELVQHSVASMFSQEPRGHLLGVYVDVSKDNVQRDQRGNWQCLHFRHIQCSNVSDSGYYSYLGFHEQETKVAAPLPNHCVPQLLPDLYNTTRARKNEGLIGKLPILIGIAAFSAASAGLEQVLTHCIKPRTWCRHNQANGRDSPLYRGMIVSICFDPKNPKGSTKDILAKLQDGKYGAFYGPSPG